MSNAPLSEAETHPDNRDIKFDSEPKNLVSQNQKYRLHLTPLSHILERAPVDKVDTKTEYNRLSIRFPASTNARKLFWAKFKTRLNHKWIQNKMELMGYFENMTFGADLKQMFLHWKGEDLYKLERLSLIFSSSHALTEKQLETILEIMIRNLVNLQEFTLSFDNNPNVTDKVLPFIGKLIARHLPNLKRLHLGFHNCKNITGERMHKLLTPLSRNLSLLEELFLNFGGCGRITDEHLALFGSNLTGHLTNLKQFMIYLWQGHNITDKGLIEFGTSICQNLVNLKKLTLNFRGTQSITLKGIYVVCDNINQKLLNLRKLVLIFEGCGCINWKSLAKMTLIPESSRHVQFIDDNTEQIFFGYYKRPV